MRVIVDAFGGDNAPLEILKGCAMAVQEYGVDIIACGSERVIRDVCEKNKISLDRISIADVEKVIPVEVDSTEIVKSYDDCTMAVGLKMDEGMLMAVWKVNDGEMLVTLHIDEAFGKHARLLYPSSISTDFRFKDNTLDIVMKEYNCARLFWIDG